MKSLQCEPKNVIAVFTQFGSFHFFALWLFIVHFSFWISLHFVSPSITSIHSFFSEKLFQRIFHAMLLNSWQKQDTKYNRLLIFLLSEFTILEWTYNKSNFAISFTFYIVIIYHRSNTESIHSICQKVEKNMYTHKTGEWNASAYFRHFERSMTWWNGDVVYVYIDVVYVCMRRKANNW